MSVQLRVSRNSADTRNQDRRVLRRSSGALAIRGWVRVMIERDCKAGLEDLDRAVSQDPDYWVSSLLRGWGLQAAGRHEGVIVMMRRALELNAMGHSVNAILAFSGRHDEARKVLGLIEEPKLHKPSPAIASAYLALGERDKAVELLKDASERGMPQFAWTRDDPRLASLRGDSEVESLWSGIWSGSP